MTEVDRAWTAIDGWLERNAPASARAQHPPADPAAIAAAEQALGLTFPADVRASLRHHDGQPAYGTDLPGYPLLTVDRMVEVRQMMLRVHGDDVGRGDDDGGYLWHEAWLPVTEMDGDMFFVDLHPGPGYGRFGWYPRDDAWTFDEGARTFAAHLTQVAAALTSGGDVDGEYPYVTESGTLVWAPHGEESTDDGERLVPVPAS